jgi:hypothetical protein
VNFVRIPPSATTKTSRESGTVTGTAVPSVRGASDPGPVNGNVVGSDFCSPRTVVTSFVVRFSTARPESSVEIARS